MIGSALRNVLHMVNRATDCDGHTFEGRSDPLGDDVICLRCREHVDVTMLEPNAIVAALLRLGPCRGGPVGDRIWFQHRRPTLRELLAAATKPQMLIERSR